MKKCRINWLSLETGFKGHKDWLEEARRKQLEDETIQLNKKYIGEMDFWVECD